MSDISGKKSRNNAAQNKPAVAHKAGTMVLRAAAQPVQVRHLDVPPRIERPTGVHPRRLLPFVAEGQERPFHSLDTRAIIHHVEAAGQQLQVVLNTPLPQPGLNQVAGNVGEPSVSVNGDVVFFTGNWYASISTDGGNTFKFIDPNAMAQPDDPPGVTFCCDQVVNYIPSIDTFVWLMQYGPRTGNNIQRLALAKTADAKAGRWRIFDVTTQALEVPGAFMDFPDLAVGANFLYMTTNIFPPDVNTAGSAVVRIPFSSIDLGNPTAEKFVSMELFSFRVAQNCRDTAYFAAHRDTSTLAVFSWPETQPLPTTQDVEVARWIGTNGYFSRTPDDRRWLDRADPRITGATLAGDELWFAWSVDANSNHRALPFVQMARINSTNMNRLEDVNLFDTESAICYAGLATNANNEVGVSYAIGGVDLYVDQTITSIHAPHRVFTKGMMHMNGDQALDWIRQRKQFARGDFARMQHQQQFLKALLEKASSTGTLTNPTELNNFLKAVTAAVTVDKSFSLTDFALQFKNIRSNDLTFITSPNKGSANVSGQSVVLSDKEKALALYKAVSSDTMSAWMKTNLKPASGS